jgi:hypothetical protein
VGRGDDSDHPIHYKEIKLYQWLFFEWRNLTIVQVSAVNNSLAIKAKHNPIVPYINVSVVEVTSINAQLIEENLMSNFWRFCVRKYIILKILMEDKNGIKHKILRYKMESVS